MIRVAAVAAALVLFVLPQITAPIPVVLAAGVIGLVLAATGMATLWRWPGTAAACIFVTDYALALWVGGPSVGVVEAAGFGLALLVLLQSLELARCARHATVDAGVVRSLIVGWTGFAAATMAIAMLIMALARGVAAAIPFAAAPLVAAACALGVVLALAVALSTARA